MSFLLFYQKLSIRFTLANPCFQQRPTPRLWGATMVKTGQYLRHTKRAKNDPQMNVCTSLADSYNSPQATAACETGARFCWGVWAHRVHQGSVIDSQKGLTRCFRDLKLLTSSWRVIERSKNISLHAREHTKHFYITAEKTASTKQFMVPYRSVKARRPEFIRHPMSTPSV